MKKERSRTRTRRMGKVVGGTLIALTTVLLGSPAAAQYFGRNKVQYRDFDFKVQKTEHFDIYYYPEERQTVDAVARMAERWYERLSRLFDTDLKGRQPLIFYASSPDFRQTNAIRGELGEGTGGVTEGLRRRIVMPAAGGLAETDHVLGHELVHAFQYDMADRRRAGGMRLPLWAMEGLAEYLSVGPVDSQTAMWLRDSLAHDDLPTLEDLDDPRFFPYRYGQAFWAYVGGRWGDDKAVFLFKEMMRTGNPEAAVKRILEIEPEQLSRDWATSIRTAYGQFLDERRPPSEYGPILIDDEKGGGRINVGPALSPDGMKMVFLSERDLFSVDLFLVDLKTDEVRKLASTATDPHFDSLQFIDSAGSWSPDGRRFAQAAVRHGRGALVIFDTTTGARVREAVFDDLGELHTPSWGPDGRRVVFSALEGGAVDLWIYDLETGVKRRLTKDRYAELQPVISPDGTRVVFATDRFTTSIDTLDYESYRLGRLDLASGAIDELPGYEGARHTDPQWSPDGDSLFFVSNVSGAPNIHRLDLSTGRLVQVTDLRTGVAGIAPLSPSLSVARVAGRIAYSAREDGQYPIYALEAGAAFSSSPTGAPPARSPAILPPRSQPGGEVARLRGDARSGLPTESPPPPREYDPDLALEFVGRPTIGVGVDRFGSFIGGGAALFFSDMLGNRNLGLSIQSRGGLKDIGGDVSWTNLTHRLDWSVGLQHVPYVYAGGFSRSLETSDGQPVIVDRQEIRRQTYSTAYARGAWPLNRSQRFEVQGSVRRVGFSREIRTDVYSPGGQFLGHDEQGIDADFAPLYLGATSAAFVHDASVFGATSPVAGSRARIEVSETFGSVSHTDVLVDYRRYFLPVRPITFALRLTHYGRYGAGAEDERFQSLYLGYAEFVRGYDGISGDECRPTDRSPCPVYERLFGSRLALANAELRAPLFGLFRGRMTYGPLPIEIAVFADAGVAWTSEHKASFLGGDRDVLTSVGAALRANVFGFAIVQTSIAHPFDRPGNEWVWQWSLTPGF